jgi:hypothetical protein
MSAATNKKPPMASVIHEQQCVGFLIARGPVGVEAFDAAEHSLGTFTDERDAVAAIFTHKPIRGAS